MIAFLAEYPIFFFFLVIPYLWLKKAERHDLIRISVTVVLAFAIEEGINRVLSIPRPFVAQNFTPLIGLPVSEYYHSFPSGHATILSALGASVFFTEKIPGEIIFLGAIIVGSARVLAGVHYWTDILGGLGLGIGVSVLVYLLHKKSPIW